MSVSKQKAFLRLCPRCKAPLAPGSTACLSCGYRLAPVPPNSTIQPPSPVPPSYRRRQEPSPLQRRAPLLYFLSVFLVIILFTFVALHAAGISPSTLFAKRTVPVQAVTYPVPKVPALFSDDFTGDTYGWNLQSSPGDYTVTLGNGSLTLQVYKNKLLWEPLPGQRSFSNFTLTVNATLSKGDQNNGYGVYIRGSSNAESDLASYYRFELYGDGSYAVFKGATDASGHSSDTKLVDYTLHPAIQKQGKVNHIMIIAKGANLSFIVNGQLLKTITDHSYSSGSVALFVSNLPEAKPGAAAQFSALNIYPAQ
ncbi:MAG TPA: family 16 glycoside hydrolase [Ktedonobacteraceae bacterium]|jgi:hypothetical protein|nr:family 16 glycoside hydrolase [Ktedonobacteraceae bacterium]